MKQTYVCLVILTCLCSPLLAGQRANVKPAPPAPAVLEAPKNEAAPKESEPHARVVQYSQQDVIQVKAKVRYTTLIVLPKNEQILDFTCGDKEFWVINGDQNFAYVKPATAASETNLNLVTASGNIYSFILVEISGVPDSQPDLKVFIEPKE